MKKYQSHKVVEAAPIYGTDPSTNTVVISEAGHPRYEVEVPKDFFSRGVPGIGDYLVRYQPDGYLSWSPRKAFEAGYSELGEAAQQNEIHGRADNYLIHGEGKIEQSASVSAAVEVTVAAPAGKRAEVSIGRPGGSTSWTVTEGQSKTWSVVVGEALVVCEGEPHSTVARKRDAS
jgi:hypothetical protein